MIQTDWASKVWLAKAPSAWPSVWHWLGAVIFAVVFFGAVPFVGYLAGF